MDHIRSVSTAGRRAIPEVKSALAIRRNVSWSIAGVRTRPHECQRGFEIKEENKK